MPAKKKASRREQPPPAEEPETSRASLTVGREQILGKYWELANLDPEATKGTITGQLKALDSLCEELGLTPPSVKSGERMRTQEIYRSAWMRPAAGRFESGE